MKPEEGLEMKTSRLLISSAMLTAMCDTQSVDNLKLLERFVTMCIADSTTVGKKIDKQRILELMDQQYAFSNMPLSVLDKILQRMARPRDSYIISRQKAPVCGLSLLTILRCLIEIGYAILLLSAYPIFFYISSGTNFSSSARLSFDEYPHSTELRASIAI